MNEIKPDRLDQLLEFDTIFPNEEPLTPEEYLKGGNKSIILNIATFFLSFKIHDSKYHNSKSVIETIFGKKNNGFANEVYSKIIEIEKGGTKVTIINRKSSLDLFEYFFKLNEEEQTQSPDEFELNFFKAYLVFNSRFAKEQRIALSSTEKLEEIRLPMMFFCSSYPYTDKVNYNIKEIWITQIVKAVWFFEFLEQNKQTQFLLSEFLKYFNCATWQDYLHKLIPLTTTAVQNEEESQIDIIISIDKDYDKNVSFIEKLILIEQDELDDNDYITLRAKPFYKLKDGAYRIIFNLFVVEKIFKGLYFILRDINNNIPKPNKVSELKSLYGLEYSEKTLLYKLMDLIYSQKSIKINGEDLTKLGIVGAPDYYIRKGKNILLFESKDFLIPAREKVSFDFKVYEEAFEEKLYYKIVNGKEKRKAIMQLIASIKRVLKKDFSADTSYNYRDVSIYPILITHDHQYDASGFNTLINSWFQEELDLLSDKKYFINRVKPLIVINIDTVIYHQVPLSHNIQLHDLIDKYIEETKINKHLVFNTDAEAQSYSLSKLVPFSVFADRFMNKNRLSEMPPLIQDIEKSLFKNISKK